MNTLEFIDNSKRACSVRAYGCHCYRLDDWCVAVTAPLVDEYREVARDYIADRVKLWSAEDLAEQLELGIGADLQYIRYNGTLIGGLIGLLLFGCLEAMRFLMG